MQFLKELSYRLTSSYEQESAELFSSYFSSVYSSTAIDLDLDTLNILGFDLPSNINLSINDVYHGLSKLWDNWSVGPDSICGELLFQLIFIISYPLWLIFNKSLNESDYPSILKLSSITPIPKSGDPSVLHNYRPIIILPHIPKVFKKLVLIKIQPSINNIIIEEQHGFFSGHSTTTYNVVFCNFVFNAFSQNSQISGFYTDFKIGL